MGPRRWVFSELALAALAGAAPGDGFLDRFAEGRLVNLRVRKFLVGHLEANTDRFIARGGRNEQAVLRDEMLYFEFSGPVDIESVDFGTVRIGTPTSTGGVLPATGSFYPHVVKEFDPISGTFVPKRRHRNRFLFDPTSRQEPTVRQNPYGFDADTSYVVIIPGADDGAERTVRTPGGSPVRAPFRTTFRTTDAQLVDYRQPSVILLEASDAPGIPLDGRTGVDPAADIVAYFSEPMLAASFDAATTFRVFDPAAGAPVPGTVLPPTDRRVATFRIDPAFDAAGRSVVATLTTDLLDRAGNPLFEEATATFTFR